MARGERGRPLARDGDGAQRPALVTRALRRHHRAARARLRARRDHPRPARGERPHREPVRGRRPPARGHARRAVRARARLRRARRARRRRRVAALRLPRPPPPDAVSEGDHVQQQRHRRRRPLDRREGRPRHRADPRGRADGARARDRDVHPRRRLAGALGRLAARLARVPGAALATGAPRFPDSEFQAVREAIAPMRLGPVVDAAALPPLVRDLQAAPGVDLPPDRRRAARLQHGRARGRARTRRAS